ncbi:glucokinase [Cardiobacterium hominis]
MPSLNLLADIGGTNARFALSDGTRLFAIQTLPTADYPTLQDAIRAYLQAQSETVAQAAIAIANPVTGDHIQMTNHHWSFSIAAMRHELRLEKLRVINDFTAQALAIPRLTATEKRAVRAGEAVAGTPIAVLGPGTGLGVSGLIPNGDRWIALASEGGHVSFAPRDDAELAIWQYARIQYGHVSAERLINGAGLSLIDSALANAENDVSNRSPAEITAAALAGEARARATLYHFSAFLATVAADLVLTLGARGGVYLCGGILPRVADYFINQSPFNARFTDKGRFAAYLDAVPVWLVTAENPGLLGAAEALQG